MRSKRSGLVGLVTVFAVTLALALPAAGGGRPLTADLNGANEVNPPMVSDATGFARVTLNQGRGEVCARITSSGYAADELLVAGHIHVGDAGVNGPVVVNLQVTSTDHDLCVDGVDKDLIKDIRQNPGDYYINLHSNLIPSGVIRGQLSK